MTDPEMLPKAVDLRRAFSCLSAYAQGNLRETSLVVKEAHEDDGRSFWIVVALVWMLCKLAGLIGHPDRIAALQQDINALLVMEDEEDAADE